MTTITRPPAAPVPNRSWPVERGLIPARGPQRVIALATFVNMVGTGVFMTSAALFFTRSVGLPLTKVALGMGAAALVGMLAGMPVGHLADRRGPREIYLITLIVRAVSMASLVFVHTFWLFVVVVCLTQLANSAGGAARGPLVRGFGGTNLTEFRSYLRSVANLAGCCGALAAGMAVQLDTRGAYLALVLGNALSFVACAAVITRLPALPPVPAPAEAGRWVVLRDRPYLVVTALDAVMSIQGQVLVFALPLWITLHTDAPRWFIGVAVAVNTALVAALQVRASRGIDTGLAAGRALRRSGLAFLVGMALMAATAGLPGWVAVALLTVGIAAHTVGELWHAAASLELQFRLAPAHAQGQYTGVSGFGTGLANVVAPTVLGLLCVTWGAPGWLLMGAVFVVVGLLSPLVVRWAERTRLYAV
ncbi:MFS transporter [Catellatospora methionotrophica]|uniref:MFS transporter n=1 Tax=Catellatospora methionotrophica TaxID=121620 RepID=A0A8J3LG60_9ACTN|nr:MFS transporter [Catellatospora methionotrophica]GIG18727.1 MFS transporter [Catellatospora methionotrophica]